jgi:two-component system KDP operon response regulator KdpE
MSPSTLRLLIVDDEQAIRRFLRTALSAHDHTLFEADSGEAGLQAVIAHRPDLIILDLGLPDIDGVEVTRRLRQWSQLPIIILSVRGGEADKVAALDAGADDYLTKPFGVGELMARIRAAMRRLAPASGEPVLTVGDLTVDLTRRRVTLAGADLSLTPTEYDLLRLLILNAGRVLTHRHLLREIWGGGSDEELHLLRVNISNLRRKIETDPSRPGYLLTEPGVGYRLRSEG